MDVVKILSMAKGKIPSPDKWIKRYFAKDMNGVVVDLASNKFNILAEQYCARGAVICSIMDVKGKSFGGAEHTERNEIAPFLSRAVEELYPRKTGHSYSSPNIVANFNNRDDVTHEDVIRVFDRAIQLAQNEA